MITLYVTEFPCGTRNYSLITGWGREGIHVRPDEHISFDVPIDEMRIRRVKTPYSKWLRRSRRKRGNIGNENSQSL